MDLREKKITFAPQDRLAAVEALAPRFFREVVGYEFAECLVTDESDLRDFTDAFGDHNAEVQAMLDRLEVHYLVDGRAAGSTRIIDLLEFLQVHGVTG
jgi:hypothetical protein